MVVVLDVLHPLAARARAGEEIPVRCACGYDSRGALRLVDRYTAERPPGPRRGGEWLEVRDPNRDEGYAAAGCPKCGECWPDAVAEVVACRTCDGEGILSVEGFSVSPFSGVAVVDPQMETDARCPGCHGDGVMPAEATR